MKRSNILTAVATSVTRLWRKHGPRLTLCVMTVVTGIIAERYGIPAEALVEIYHG